MGVVFTGLFAFGLVIVHQGGERSAPRSHPLRQPARHPARSDHPDDGHRRRDARHRRSPCARTCSSSASIPATPAAIGLNTHVLNYLLLSLLALTIVASLQAVGIILVIAMLVTPGCIGLSAHRPVFAHAWLTAVGSAVFSSLAGVYVSFFINGSTGACIVLVQALIFLVALIFAPKRGLLVRRRVTEGLEGARATVTAP